MFCADELAEARHDITSRDKLPLFQLIEKKAVKRIEKRTHTRFPVNQDAFAFALIRPAAAMTLTGGNRSMAEIAMAAYRSKPTKFGRINEISMGGLSFRYIAGEVQSNQSLVLDIVLSVCGFYLGSLTFKSIADVEMADDFPVVSIKMRCHRVQFEGLVPDQVSKLDYLIRNFSVSEV